MKLITTILMLFSIEALAFQEPVIVLPIKDSAGNTQVIKITRPKDSPSKMSQNEKQKIANKFYSGKNVISELELLGWKNFGGIDLDDLKSKISSAPIAMDPPVNLEIDHRRSARYQDMYGVKQIILNNEWLSEEDYAAILAIHETLWLARVDNDKNYQYSIRMKKAIDNKMIPSSPEATKLLLGLPLIKVSRSGGGTVVGGGGDFCGLKLKDKFADIIMQKKDFLGYWNLSQEQLQKFVLSLNIECVPEQDKLFHYSKSKHSLNIKSNLLNSLETDEQEFIMLESLSRLLLATSDINDPKSKKEKEIETHLYDFILQKYIEVANEYTHNCAVENQINFLSGLKEIRIKTNPQLKKAFQIAYIENTPILMINPNLWPVNNDMKVLNNILNGIEKWKKARDAGNFNFLVIEK